MLFEAGFGLEDLVVFFGDTELILRDFVGRVGLAKY